MSEPHRPGLLAVTLAHITVDMHTGSLVVLLPLLLGTFDLTYASAAAIVTVNSLVIAVAQPLFGTFGDRRSLKWLVWAGCLVAGAAMISVLFLPSYWLVLLAVMLSGLGSAAFHPEALSRVRAISGRFAASGTSIFFAGGNVGFALGPILATLLIARFGNYGVLILLLPTLAALGLLASQWPVLSQGAVTRAKTAGVSPSLNARAKVAGVVSLLMSLIILRSTTVGGLQSFIPLYFNEDAFVTSEKAAFLVTLLLASGVVGTLSGGIIADRIGRKPMMIITMVIAFVGLYVFLHSDGLLRMLAVAVSGATMSAAWPVIVVMIQEAMPNNVGLASGLSLGTAYGATGLGVAALGNVADTFGLGVTMQVITLLPLGVLVLTFLIPERVAKPAVVV